MTAVYSTALDETIEIDRVIAQVKGSKPGPTLIFMGGIHGNEPAGIFAMKRVADSLQTSKTTVSGQVYFIAGNLAALSHGKRYEVEDLNRMWTRQRLQLLPDDEHEATHPEMQEQITINNLMRNILKRHTGPFYFFDIHTTSSHTPPFLTVNDSLLNRAYTRNYPIPVILGIEEYLKGPILSYINELGYIAFGFEAGQHDDPVAIENAVAFCYLSLVFTGACSESDVSYNHRFSQLQHAANHDRNTYEIFYRYPIHPNEHFEMKPGLINFEEIEKKDNLAMSNRTPIKAKSNGRIFMPLYQTRGEDGFFIVRPVKRSFLNFSTFLRKHRADRVLLWLPGVRCSDQQKSTLMIDRTVAVFFAKKLLHLMGYRSIEKGHRYLEASNRESASRKEAYAKAPWFKSLYDPI